MSGRTHATRPRALAAGARVALVAPGGPVDPDRIERSVAHCHALGLEPVVFPCASARERYMAGKDAERLADLQAAFDDPGIDAVWALRGGYGSLRILEDLALERQLRDPIPFIGFSDNTSLHVRHAELGVISFHGPHPAEELSPSAEVWLRRMLFETNTAGMLPSTPGVPKARTLASGVVEGPLVGGNLAILAALCGTRHTPRAAGAILFLEDVGEPPYRVDRMLVQLERSGVMAGAVGLAFGSFTNGEDEAAAGVRHVLTELAERVGLPAVADLPFGHVAENCLLPVGAHARLDADAATLAVLEPAVRRA